MATPRTICLSRRRKSLSFRPRFFSFSPINRRIRVISTILEIRVPIAAPLTPISGKPRFPKIRHQLMQQFTTRADKEVAKAIPTTSVLLRAASSRVDTQKKG